MPSVTYVSDTKENKMTRKILAVMIMMLTAICSISYAGGYQPVPRDTTSIVYMAGDRLVYNDSLRLFMPLSTRNLNDFTVKSFGIRAKYIEYKLPTKQYFHIDLNRDPIREKYPWEVIFPLLLSFIMVQMARFIKPGHIGEIFLINFFHNSFVSNVRERNVNADRAVAELTINYILNAALFVMIALYRYNYVFGIGFILSFLTLLLLIMAVYLVKRSISYVFAELFGCEDVFVLHYKNLSYVMCGLGVFLLCANICNIYVNIQWAHDCFFWATVLGIVAAEVLKILRLFKIIIEKHFPIFYLFLYLCAVEFLPILVVVKILSR